MKAARWWAIAAAAGALLALAGYLLFFRSRGDGPVEVQVYTSGSGDYAWRLPVRSKGGGTLELGLMERDQTWVKSLLEPIPVEPGSRSVVVLVSGIPKAPLGTPAAHSISLSVLVLDGQQAVKHASSAVVDNFIQPTPFLGVIHDKTTMSDLELLSWKRQSSDQDRPFFVSLVARMRDRPDE